MSVMIRCLQAFGHIVYVDCKQKQNKTKNPETYKNPLTMPCFQKLQEVLGYMQTEMDIEYAKFVQDRYVNVIIR